MSANQQQELIDIQKKIETTTKSLSKGYFKSSLKLVQRNRENANDIM